MINFQKYLSKFFFLFEYFHELTINFKKGVALIGSDVVFTNLGRYWPQTGPQVTLYTPGAFMKPNSYNDIVMIEFEGTSCTSAVDCYVEFIDYPIIDSLIL